MMTAGNPPPRAARVGPGHRTPRTLLALTLTLSGLSALAVCRWSTPDTVTARPMVMTGAWLQPAGPPSYSGYFRHPIELPGPVKHAWIAVTARDAFEVTVNGNSVGYRFLWRAAHPLQFGSSETGQAVNPVLSSLGLNYPREFQWGDHRNDWFPTFLDITSQLGTGKNLLCIEAETRTAPTLVRLDGEIELWSGERIRIDSGPDWLGEPLPPDRPPYDWDVLEYPDHNWRKAVVADSDVVKSPSTHYRVFDPRAMTTAFRGEWIRHAETSSANSAWFETTWDLGRRPSEAWLRLASNRSYDLFINGRHVSVPSATSVNRLAGGDWVYGTQQGTELIDPLASAEFLELAESESVFEGGRFELPGRRGSSLPTSGRPRGALQRDSVRDDHQVWRGAPAGGQGAGGATAPGDSRIPRVREPGKSTLLLEDSLAAQSQAGVHPIPKMQIISTPQGFLPPSLKNLEKPTLKPGQSIAAPIASGPRGAGNERLSARELHAPQNSIPQSLMNDRGIGTLMAYGIAGMLKRGRNTIAIRLAPPESVEAYNWPPQIALDAEAVLDDEGRTREAIHSGSVPGWSTYTQDAAGRTGGRGVAASSGPALVKWAPLPPTRFLGQAFNNDNTWLQFLLWMGASFAVVALAVALLTSATRMRTWTDRALPAANRDEDGGTPALFEVAAQPAITLLTVANTVLLSAFLVAFSWEERSEIVFFRQPTAWAMVLFLGASLGIISAVGVHRRRAESFDTEGPPGPPSGRITRSYAWQFSVGFLLALCAFIRVYELDFQGFNDDEYASTQAILAIAHTGIPQYVPEEVWYSRSPLFHYLAAGFVVLGGENVWSLRLPVVWLSVATGLLIYQCGARLMNRPWVGLGALALFTIHPLTAYIGHIARFYQQQQFFALLTIYWFCLGFVSGSSQKYRYLSIGAFLAAVLSQEITAVMGLQILIGVLLFGRDNGVRANLKLLVVAGCALTAVILDVLIMFVRCQTRTEGFSSNVEATIQPHIWLPYNFATLFVGYSRIHVVLTLLLLIGLPKLIRGKNRVEWTLLWFLLSGVALTNVLVTAVSVRYVYWLIPVFLLLAVRGLSVFAEYVSAMGARHPRAQGANARNAYTSVALVFSAVVLSISPWRLVTSYETKLVGDSTGAYQYINSQRRAGDVVVASEPHPHAATLEIGKIDYDISLPTFYDFFLMKHGELIDRNGGAKLVASVEQIQEICRRNPRVWICFNHEKFRTQGQNLRWEFPGSRLELFLRKNLRAVHHTHLNTVFLWDAGEGRYSTFRDNEG